MDKRSTTYGLLTQRTLGKGISLLAGAMLMLAACSADEGSAANPSEEPGGKQKPDDNDDGDDGDDKDKPVTVDAGTKPKPDAAAATGGNKPATPADAGRTDAGGSKDIPKPAALDASMPGAPDAGGGDEPLETPRGANCLDGITDYQSAGPYKFAAKTSGNVKLWVPEVPAGCKVPIVHLANGTTANCGNYMDSLERLATHGFLAACYEDPNTGAGTMGIMAFEAAMSMFPDLVDNKLGSTGHSQGGQASLVTLALAEAKWGDKMTYAGLAMEPASGYGTQPSGGTWQSYYAKITSPVFMYSGDSGTGFANSSLLGFTTGDGLVAVSWVEEGFSALNKTVEAYHWTAIGATHIPTPQEPQNQVAIAWFRWKLLGDTKACEFFKKMPDGKKWKSIKEQNVGACD